MSFVHPLLENQTRKVRSIIHLTKISNKTKLNSLKITVFYSIKLIKVFPTKNVI